MHSKSVDSLSLTRAGFIEYFLVATKLVHALTAIAPALFLLYYPGLVPVELRSNMLGLLLFFGALTVIMFQALDVYSDDIFSNRLRFRIMFFAWASAFCLLLFMYQGLGLFPYLSSKLVIFWFTGSLLSFPAVPGPACGRFPGRACRNPSCAWPMTRACCRRPSCVSPGCRTSPACSR